ncbi:MAG: YfhO family protein [Paludibacteraceae bacterium]|nr:YfhO family protein [Paludibacteraceae bacterium]
MKQLLKHLGAFVFFVIITFVYFSPKLDGKVLQQGDIQKWEGMAHELTEYYEKEGGASAWSGSMFSGMPSYTFAVKSHIPSGISYVNDIFSAFGNHDCGIVILSLLAMYVLLSILKLPTPLAILGAIAYSFSSYSFIIILAGHVTKAWAMAYIPLVVAGLLLIFRKKLIAGFFVLSISLALEMLQNHIQITYYLAFFCFALFLCYVITSIKNQSYSDIGKTLGVLFAAVVVAVLINSPRLYSDLEMSKTSIRGKSELTAAVDGKDDKSSGLDQEYAFAWSYGIAETMTLLIPDFYGGASGGEVSAKDSHLAKAMKSKGYQVPKKLQTYTYWGDQPFTSGPVYFGAVICFLFVLSLFIVKSKYKWWIVGATVFFFILSWGKNFSALNDFFFHYLPMYNKFRTPSMALVIPQFTFALLGCMALQTIWNKDYEKKHLMKSLYISGGVTAGLCFIFACAPSLFLNFTSLNDVNMQMPDWYMSALLEDRKELLSSDALRSCAFVFLAFAGVLGLVSERDKISPTFSISWIAILVLIDLWLVDRRYLNDEHFVNKNREKSFVKTAADKAILEDKDPSYRVLTLNNPFNDTNVSYYHKSIGGYNAAKLRRYQELIDLGITPEMQMIITSLRSVTSQNEVDDIFKSTPVLNMLNMRYLIYNEKAEPIRNPSALGNAWFVDEVKMVENADAEMSALKSIDPKRTALVDVRFKDMVSAASGLADTAATVNLTSYKPNEVKYSTNSTKDGVLLFSEVYYQPGWQAYLDGKEVEHFRANWILRGMNVPAGTHEIRFEFYPSTYWSLRWVGFVASMLLLIAAVAYAALYYYKKNKQEVPATNTIKE